VDLIEDAAIFNARRQAFPLLTVFTGAFYQITDFKVELISFDGHNSFTGHKLKVSV